jgi:bacterioferritin-associated ferredoxin
MTHQLKASPKELILIHGSTLQHSLTVCEEHCGKCVEYAHDALNAAALYVQTQ